MQIPGPLKEGKGSCPEKRKDPHPHYRSWVKGEGHQAARSSISPRSFILSLWELGLSWCQSGLAI